MNKVEVEKIGNYILNNDPAALISMISLKQQMQRTFINDLTRTESLEIAQNIRSQVTINKLYRLGNKSLQTISKSDTNTYCVGLVVATILKELFEDESFVHLEKLSDIIKNIQ